MSTTICAPCVEFQCVCSVPECANTINLGQIPNVNTLVFITIEKQNGSQILQSFTSEADGTIKLDMTDPNTSYYNHFDGLYLVWATLGGYYCENDKLEMTATGVVSTTYGITFRKAQGTNFNEVFIEPVV